MAAHDFQENETSKISIFSEKVALHGRMRPGPFHTRQFEKALGTRLLLLLLLLLL